MDEELGVSIVDLMVANAVLLAMGQICPMILEINFRMDSI
jgi:hypothetical protein